ncbi:hypothetical protein [Streptomyces canus]|uniref:hypothetical protein n=1 Tax=Streptomyces canus TaxID=58343 RepID=UPI0036E859F6
MAASLRAGGVVYDELSEAEPLRRDLVTAATDLWSLSAGQSSQLLATWCAYALHTLGEELACAEYAARPRLKGYMTADQAMVFLTAAGTWSGRPRRAAADPGYDIAAETRLPAPLPWWSRGEPCPPTHVETLLTVARALRERAQAALADFLATRVPDERRGAAERLRGLLAEADAEIGRAEQMWTPSRSSRCTVWWSPPCATGWSSCSGWASCWPAPLWPTQPSSHRAPAAHCPARPASTRGACPVGGLPSARVAHPRCGPCP